MSSERSATAARPLASIVVPAYNEGPQLVDNIALLSRYLARAAASYDYEIVLVDDGSTDGIFKEIAATCFDDGVPVRVVHHSSNRGLGCAIRTGFALAHGSVAVVFDSDLSYAPDIIPQLLAQMDRNGDDLVLASSYMPGGKISNVPFVRRLLSREANRFLSLATNGRFATLTCMVRAYRLEFFRNLESNEERMEINAELLLKASAGGARISEIPAILCWSAQRAKTRGRIDVRRTLRQIGRTMRYGIGYRPALLLALPGIVPGVLPLIVATAFLVHLPLPAIAVITAITVIVQHASLALFAGQLVVFGRNLRHKPGRRDSPRLGPRYKRPEI